MGSAQIWVACTACGAPEGRACRDDNDEVAPTCRGRAVSKHRCCKCHKHLPLMGRKPDARFPCCGRRECSLFAKREWTRADRAKKREVTT